MFITISGKSLILVLFTTILIIASVSFAVIYTTAVIETENNTASEQIIKWVDFNASYQAMCDAMEADISTHGTEHHVKWTDVLAYLAVKNGNDFSRYNKKYIAEFADKIKSGVSIESLEQELKYFSYYRQCFQAVLGEYIGEYAVQVYDTDADEVVWQRKYGLKVFSPIAKNYSFNHYDDFAASRSYGYKRLHTGHDLMGSIGTPVVAIESGVVESCGWNQYGGWRIGIRSFDKKRYYYYAHLRKDHPYTPIVKEGEIIKAGDVIGYLGMTGYSTKENVNNINVPHLHMGVQLIFDESQKDSPNEIWIDAYNLVKFLQKNSSEVYRDDKTGEFVRKYDFYEAAIKENTDG